MKWSLRTLARLCTVLPPVVLLQLTGLPQPAAHQPATDPYRVKHCADFHVNGLGDNREWQKTAWQPFTKIDSGGIDYPTRSKILYSNSGIYLLFTGKDNKITTKEYHDFEEIYEGDVFEAFFRPDRSRPQYFEYEINALGRELILTLTRTGQKTLAWSPWNYEYRHAPLVQKAVSVSGGDRVAGALIHTWTAELFLPYQLLALLPGVVPKSGDTWDANFGRIDYDSGRQIQWSWSKAIKRDFHELEHFGQIEFE